MSPNTPDAHPEHIVGALATDHREGDVFFPTTHIAMTITAPDGAFFRVSTL